MRQRSPDHSRLITEAKMNAVIVTIGDEILIGQITDTNSAWIAQQLTPLGIQVREMVSIQDTPEHIVSTLDRLTGTVDLVLITGGLGPTKDDLTKATLATYFGGELIENKEVLAMITEFFRKRGRGLLDSNRKQALVPENCRILNNNFGTAPGLWFSRSGSEIIAMPGVPYEMKPMVLDQLIPAILEMKKAPQLFHRTVMTHAVPESYLSEMLRNWEAALPGCIKLAYLPRPGIVRLRLTATGKCAEDADRLMNEYIGSLNALISEHIFAFTDTVLEKVLGEILLEQGLSLSTAESCTGGTIARFITSIPGSSRYFKGSVVAYSNDIKERLLMVPHELLEEHGAVSREVAEAMARGALRQTRSDTAIAVSGIAGPDGGTKEKPVGTIWIAAAHGNKVISSVFSFGGSREIIIEQSAVMGMGMLYKLLKNIHLPER